MSLPTQPALTPATEREATGQEFIQTLLGPNAKPEDVEAVARAWLISETEIRSITTHPDPHKTALEHETRIAITAAVAEAATNKLGRVTTGAIQTATDEQLVTWTENYEQLLTENYAQQLRVTGELAQLAANDQEGTTEWLTKRDEFLTLREQFDRLAGFLWECQERSGLNRVLASMATAK